MVVELECKTAISSGRDDLVFMFDSAFLVSLLDSGDIFGFFFRFVSVSTIHELHSLR